MRKLAARSAGLILQLFLLACTPATEDVEAIAPLTVGRLRQALQIQEPTPEKIWARIDSFSERRDIVTQYLTLHAGDSAIPAVACYSRLGESRQLPTLLWMPGSPNVKEDLINTLDLLPTWADRGFFVFSIDRPFHGDRPGDREHEIRQRGFPAVLGVYIVDLQRAVDYLMTRPEVDTQRVGMIGLSTGGLEALILGAIDPRLKAIICVSGQVTWPEVFASDAWKRIFAGLPVADSLIAAGAPGVRALAVLTERMPGLTSIDASRVAPLIAPRPLLLLGGVNDLLVPGASSHATAAAAERAYARQSALDHFTMRLEPGRGHAFSKKMQTQTLAWCERWL